MLAGVQRQRDPVAHREREHRRTARRRDPQVRQPDITLARELLGWEPEIELREGLQRTLQESGPEVLVGVRRG
jgi:nucleoside-diphosphate-sugar epimerase